FANAEWHFPSIIEEAVKAHDLSFKPPGYYHRIYPDSMEVVLRYDAHFWELDNDRQRKETLYPKAIYAYCFRLPGSDDSYDSLRHSLEAQFKSNFVTRKGLRKERVIREKDKPYAFDFLTVNASFVVGLRYYRTRPGKQVIEV